MWPCFFLSLAPQELPVSGAWFVTSVFSRISKHLIGTTFLLTTTVYIFAVVVEGNRLNRNNERRQALTRAVGKWRPIVVGDARLAWRRHPSASGDKRVTSSHRGITKSKNTSLPLSLRCLFLSVTERRCRDRKRRGDPTDEPNSMPSNRGLSLRGLVAFY